MLNGINTQAAEQLFSWVKGYANILSALGWRKMPIYLLLLFHYKNLERVNIRPTHIFNIVTPLAYIPIFIEYFQISLIPNLPTISLTYIADIQQILQQVSRFSLEKIFNICKFRKPSCIKTSQQQHHLKRP